MVAEFTVAEFSGCPVYRCPIFRCPLYRCPVYRLPSTRLACRDSGSHNAHQTPFMSPVEAVKLCLSPVEAVKLCLMRESSAHQRPAQLLTVFFEIKPRLRWINWPWAVATAKVVVTLHTCPYLVVSALTAVLVVVSTALSLSAPATSVASEQPFSAAGQISRIDAVIFSDRTQRNCCF